MAEKEMKNAPPLYGWAIAAGAGAVAFGVSLLVVGIEGNGSVFIGVVIALIVGIIFTVAEQSPPPLQKRVKAEPAPTVASPAPAAPSSSAEKPAAPADATPPPAASVAPVAADASAGSSEPAAQAGTKPQGLASAQGQADDLKQISGVGPVLEGKLNNLGIFHFWQIAQWGKDEIAWVDGFLNFKGRIERDDWVAQAGKLAETSPAKPSA